MAEDTIGQRLIAIRKRSGMTLADVAAAMDLGGRSSVQRFFDRDLAKLSVDDALRLADVFVGKGNPQITQQEILSLSGLSSLPEVAPIETAPSHSLKLARDVPVYGTAMGTYKLGGEGQEIEQAFIDPNDVIEHLARPPGYAHRTGLYALYVTGSSMEPRWESGDPLYVDPKRQPAIGDDVIVYLMQPIGEDRELEAVLLKRLVRRSTDYIELEQFNPAMIFRLETRRIRQVHRVIPRRELLAFS